MRIYWKLLWPDGEIAAAGFQGRRRQIEEIDSNGRISRAGRIHAAATVAAAKKITATGQAPPAP